VLVTGKEQAPFSAPGDSGAVVRMKDTNEVVGIVSSITFEKTQQLYSTSVKPVWTFFSAACDVAEYADDVYLRRNPADFETEEVGSSTTDDRMVSPDASEVCSCVVS
jgi:hypothetical protein